MGGSLLDERGSSSRRWADLGVVRASELRERRTGRGAVSPVPEPEPEPPRTAVRTDREGDPVLPVVGPLAGLLSAGGLRRGSTVAVGGSTSLVLALLAEASRAGSWCALVGLPGVGVAAAAEAGLDLSRTAFVPRPGPRPATVVAALVDGVDMIVLDTTLPGTRWSAGDRQRLGARVRQRGAVLLPVVTTPGTWPGADVELHVAGGTWAGLGGDGAGRLRSRRVCVRGSSRTRPGTQEAPVLLPGPAGACAPEEEAGGRVPLPFADLPRVVGATG